MEKYKKNIRRREAPSWTCYDEFLNVRLESKPEEIQTRIKKLGNLFLSHGARTSKQQAEYNLQNMKGVVNAYDYSIIDTW